MDLKKRYSTHSESGALIHQQKQRYDKPSPATWRSRCLEAWNWILYICSSTLVRISILVAVIAFCYYYYLNSLYLVDEVYDVNGLRELTQQEKFTIRTIAPHSNAALKDFVAKYSVCQAVAEIHIVWGHSHEDPPPIESFTYPKTHGPVVYEYPLHNNIGTDKDQYAYHPTHYGSSIPINTEAVLLLDAQYRLDCNDLKFAHSVWRSASDTLVLPGLHYTDKGRQLQYREGWTVWWNAAYSIMKAGAVFVHKDLMALSESHAVLGPPLTTTLSKHPHCYDLGLSLFIAALTTSQWQTIGHGRPPVFVNIPHSTLSDPKSNSVRAYPDNTSNGGDKEKSNGYCLNALQESMEVAYLPYAHTMSIKAKHKIFW